ncbi:hypothetical protein [Halospeciosus flavus]|uniref:DUF7967 domain-containing protein n=1 Tax=Halospeciosus flavus TaxID=3032283 RepID=A0ABD5Z7A1_9EURY|nr:hypothetical protein [Halospeciosus flavus]
MSADDDESESETVQVWFVHREYTDKGMLSLTYATTDGEWVLERQQSMNAPDPTAAREADRDDLREVEDETDRERYATEATRMADRYDPDERV